MYTSTSRTAYTDQYTGTFSTVYSIHRPVLQHTQTSSTVYTLDNICSPADGRVSAELARYRRYSN